METKTLNFKITKEMFERMNEVGNHFQIERLKNNEPIFAYTRERLFIDLVNFAYENKVQKKEPQKIGFNIK